MAVIEQDAQIDVVKSHIAGLAPSLAGRFIYYFLPFRKRVVLHNMRLVFGARLSSQEIKTLAQSFYSHLATSIKEMLWMRCVSKKKLLDHVTVKGHETVINAAENNRGIIIMSGHFGNWELATIAGAMQFPQYHGRFHIIRKMLGVKFFERLLFGQSYDAGISVIPNRQAMLKVTEVLDKNDLVVFVMDQFASVKRKRGIWVEFFGHKVATFRSLAMIAGHTKTPVIPAVTYRKPNGEHVLEYLRPVEWIEHEDRQQEIYLNTRQYNQILESLVLRYPEQWLWLHKRFKSEL